MSLRLEIIFLTRLRLKYLLDLIDRASKIKNAWKEFHHNLNVIKTKL